MPRRTTPCWCTASVGSAMPARASVRDARPFPPSAREQADSILGCRVRPLRKTASMISPSRGDASVRTAPRIRACGGGIVVLWSVIAIVVLVALGIFGTLIATGRVTLFPTPSATPRTISTAEPVVDTSYSVTVLNATTQSGLAGSLAQTIVGAGWSPDSVTAGDASSKDFPNTTVFYSDPRRRRCGAGARTGDRRGGRDTQRCVQGPRERRRRQAPRGRDRCRSHGCRGHSVRLTTPPRGYRRGACFARVNSSMRPCQHLPERRFRRCHAG